jgi:hypothetical protein
VREGRFRLFIPWLTRIRFSSRRGTISAAKVTVQALNELEGDADSGQVLERIGTSGLAGIQYGVRGGERRGGLVVVRSDEGQSQRPSFLHLGDMGNAAVHGEDQLPPVGGEAPKPLRLQAVALFDTVRDVVGDLVGETAQVPREQGVTPSTS